MEITIKIKSGLTEINDLGGVLVDDYFYQSSHLELTRIFLTCFPIISLCPRSLNSMMVSDAKASKGF